jgi:hypothetical protein
MKKILFTAFTFLTVTLSVLALSSDYKNNLLKVDLNKVDASNYKVELYTQKPYSEPIKIIKKSDFNYYILLPETYHSITSTASNTDIKSLDVKLYPYAGADVNNGYTKVNILTSHPVNFSLVLKTASNADAPKIDTDRLAQLDKVFANKKPVETQLIPKIASAKTETKNVETKKLAKENAQKVKQIDSSKVASAQKQNVRKDEAKTQNLAQNSDYKIRTNKISTPNTTVVSIPKAKNTSVKVAGASVSPKTVSKKPLVATKTSSVKTSIKRTQTGRGQVIEIERTEDIAQEDPSAKVPVAAAASIDIPEASIPPVLDRVPQDVLGYMPENESVETLPSASQTPSEVQKEDTLTPQIALYIEKTVKDNFILIMSTFAVILALLAILMMKHQRQNMKVKNPWKNKKDKTEEKEPEIIEEIIEVPKATYGAEKIVFKEPRAAQEELYYANNPIKGNREEDTEIYTRKPNLKTQKVVTQDVSTPLNLPEIPADKDKFKKKKQAEETKIFKPTPVPPAPAPRAVQNPIKADVKPKTDEARILSAATVKDDRGFCLVSHNGIMALTGWVEENIFVLHRFKKGEIKNPLIKYRLSESSLGEEHYLVKVENFKFLIKSTRTRMGLELVV